MFRQFPTQMLLGGLLPAWELTKGQTMTARVPPHLIAQGQSSQTSSKSEIFWQLYNQEALCKSTKIHFDQVSMIAVYSDDFDLM